jgi:hypothetical protein
MKRGLQCNRDRAIAIVLLVLLLSPGLVCSPCASALAQHEAEPIRLVYHASSDCPDEATFVARVRERTTRVRLASAGEVARTFTVVVESGRAPLGRIAVQSSDHREAARQVQADTCSDVVDALALMVALAIDPGAVNPVPAAPPEGSAAASAPASSLAPTARSHDDGGMLGGVDFALATDVMPQLVLAGSPYVGWRATGARLFAPSFRLSFIRARSGTLDVTGGTATFTWTVGRLDGCPIAWPRGVLRVSECVRLEGGTLEVAGGMGVTASRTSTRGWAAVGPLARAEWALLPPVFVDAEAGALVRVTQDRFYFNPGMATAFEVPALGVTAGVGVGVLFF